MSKTIQIMIDKRGTVTNEDVIKAVFPNATIKDCYGGSLWVKIDNEIALLSESWWDSPYGGEKR